MVAASTSLSPSVASAFHGCFPFASGSFEDMTADYIEETGNHVLYRVTPVFEGNNLLATGVLMEAMSVEDDGDGVLFKVSDEVFAFLQFLLFQP